MQAPRNQVVCVWDARCSVFKLNIFSTGNKYTTKTCPFTKKRKVIPNIFTSCLRYKLLLEIQTILDAFSDENKCTTLICLVTKNQSPMGKNAFWRDPTSTFWAGILYKKHFTKYRAPYFNKRLMFGIATKTKITRGKPTWKFLVFRLRSFHRLQGWEKQKTRRNPKKTKRPKKLKSWEKCCAHRFPLGFFC